VKGAGKEKRTALTGNEIEGMSFGTAWQVAKGSSEKSIWKRKALHTAGQLPPCSTTGDISITIFAQKEIAREGWVNRGRKDTQRWMENLTLMIPFEISREGKARRGGGGRPAGGIRGGRSFEKKERAGGGKPLSWLGPRTYPHVLVEIREGVCWE